MLDNQSTRVDTVRAHVDRILLDNGDVEDRRCGYVHLNGVGMLTAMIALRRGSDRVQAKLSEIAGMLHACASYRSMADPNHAHASARMARKILTDSGAFTCCEIKTLCHAIDRHNAKDEIGAEFDEILKDADVLQHFLHHR